MLCPNIFCFQNLSQKCFDEFLLRKTNKNAFFALFRHQMGSKSLRNTVFLLAASNYPYLDTLPNSLAIRFIYMFADQVRLGQPLCCNAFYTHFCITYMFADQARLGSTLCCNAFHTHFSIIYMFDDQVRLGQALCCNAFYNHIRLWGSFFYHWWSPQYQVPTEKIFQVFNKKFRTKTPNFHNH